MTGPWDRALGLVPPGSAARSSPCRTVHPAPGAAPPAGQAEASFPLVRLGAAEADFENPAHDFPQRVIYRRDGELLRARIEGTRAGRVEGADFPMERVACPGALPPRGREAVP